MKDGGPADHYAIITSVPLRGGPPLPAQPILLRSMRIISTVDGFVAVGPSLRSHQENMESNFTRFVQPIRFNEPRFSPCASKRFGTIPPGARAMEAHQ